VNASEQLIRWSAHWDLLGNQMVCMECLAAQPAEEAGLPFVHLPGCTAKDGSPYPWRDLKAILRDLPHVQVDAVKSANDN